MLALAAAVILAFGHWRGVSSLIGLAVSFAYLLQRLETYAGIASDDDSYLAVAKGNIDMRGLLLAGIVIGALGVLDDVTVTQAATVVEMAAAGPSTRLRLYQAASRVGRAHVASAVNTIVLAYAGASLPLLLAFRGETPTANLPVAVRRRLLESALEGAITDHVSWCATRHRRRAEHAPSQSRTGQRPRGTGVSPGPMSQR